MLHDEKRDARTAKPASPLGSQTGPTRVLAALPGQKKPSKALVSIHHTRLGAVEHDVCNIGIAPS